LIAVVLNGGKSVRFGTDKCSYILESKPMVEHTIDTLKDLFDEIVLVGKPYRDFYFIKDELCVGPVGGVLTALKRLQRDIFVVGCDMPYIQPAVVNFMREIFERSKADVVLASLADGLHPLHAFYSTSMIEHLTWSIEYANASFRASFERANVIYLTEESFSHIPNWQKSFINLNTQHDLEVLKVNDDDGPHLEDR